MRTEEHVAVESARVVMQRLPAAEIIDARPGGHRPAVVNLPVKRTHIAWPDAPQMFGANLDPFSLHDLTDIKKRCKVFWGWVFAQQVFANQLVTARMLLMEQHHGRINLAFIWQRKRIDGLDFGKRLKTVFTHEPRELFFVSGKWQSRMPDAPVMRIADALRLGISFQVRTRRAGPVRP